MFLWASKLPQIEHSIRSKAVVKSHGCVIYPYLTLGYILWYSCKCTVCLYTYDVGLCYLLVSMSAGSGRPWGAGTSSTVVPRLFLCLCLSWGWRWAQKTVLSTRIVKTKNHDPSSTIVEHWHIACVCSRFLLVVRLS